MRVVDATRLGFVGVLARSAHRNALGCAKQAAEYRKTEKLIFRENANHATARHENQQRVDERVGMRAESE